jgi:pyrimidine-nucleoside phosphorylase
VRAPRDGFVFAMDTERVGTASVVLGAGRATKEDAIDYTAGIRLARKTGDPVAAGEALGTIYAAREDLLDAGERILLGAYDIRDERPASHAHFYARISREGIERF